MNTSNTGHPVDPAELPADEAEAQAEAESTEKNSGRSWGLILVGVGLLLFAVFIGTRVIGVFYGILVQPDVPLPAGLTEVSHNGIAYGVDEWIYSSNDSVLTLATAYEELGATCTQDAQVRSFGPFARCYGSIDFSSFTMRWHADLLINTPGSEQTTVRIFREVYWLGEGPEPGIIDPSLSTALPE